MREYIYRGIPVERHKWIYNIYKNTHSHFTNGFVYGSLVKTDDKVFIAVSAMARTNEFLNNGIATLVEVDPSTVDMYMMYSDIDGQFIFEGDIVKFADKQGPNTKYYYGTENYPCGESFAVEMIPSIWAEIAKWHTDLQVIGNIYQEVK